MRRGSGRSAFRRSISCWIAARNAASTGLANSGHAVAGGGEDPAVVPGDQLIDHWRRTFSVASVPSSSAAMRRE
jgi:hypothetical protein